MTDSPTPSYERPPVTEVALAIYFSPLLAVPSARMGKLWERWKDRYPQTQDQPPMPPVAPETFPSPPAGMAFQFMGSFPGTRTWFISENGDHLIQVQHDRLVLNWRRTSVDDPYPRYETLRPAFVNVAEEFLSFVAKEELGQVIISQAEVTYVNPIPIAELGPNRELSRLIAPWSSKYSDGFLPMTEDVRLGLRFRIPEPKGEDPVGRLYVEGNLAIHQSPGMSEINEVYMLQLFARGKPLGDDGLPGALAFMDLGHDWVVNGFTSLTTEQMHEKWGYQDDNSR